VTEQDTELIPSADAGSFDAFLSYSSSDGRKVRWIHRFLQSWRAKGSKRALRVYLDRTDIRGGALRPELEEALRRARHLVVCCSNAAADSEWVATEVSSYRGLRPDPSIALILLSGEPAQATPAPLRDLDLRYHDLRRGGIFWRYHPRNRDELLRLLALLSGQELRSLINWNRRRVVGRVAIGAAALAAGGTATGFYVQSLLQETPADVTARITYGDAEFQDNDNSVGEGLAGLFVENTVLTIVGVPEGPGQRAMPVKWPFVSPGFQARDPPMRLESRSQAVTVDRKVSVDGTWTRSIRVFQQFSGSLGPLADRSLWQGARFEARIESVVPRGTAVPKPREPAELAARFNAHYRIDERDRDANPDYGINPVPIRAELEMFLGGVFVGKSEGIMARVFEWDEDVRNLHVVYFPAFDSADSARDVSG
jgi:TIR domain